MGVKLFPFSRENRRQAIVSKCEQKRGDMTAAWAVLCNVSTLDVCIVLFVCLDRKEMDVYLVRTP